ncbi:XdhC family protein [Sulfodiicoccus acidiphilus]|nr:XdhC family protein [Sulfodiicoccus acidiphilus]
MRMVVFSSSAEAEMEEPVVCDANRVTVDASKCKGSSISVAPFVARFAKEVGFHVTVVDPFAQEGTYHADVVIRGTTFEVEDEVVRGAYSVVATRHVYDTWAVMKSVFGGAKEVAVVMSVRRAQVILRRLLQAGLTREQLARLRLPAGLDLGASNEREIALSIVAEALAAERGGTGRPLSQLKDIGSVVGSL